MNVWFANDLTVPTKIVKTPKTHRIRSNAPNPVHSPMENDFADIGLVCTFRKWFKE